MSQQQSVSAQLRGLIEQGETPKEATETVMRDLPKRWQDFSRPFVLRAARGIEGQVVNRRMRRALGPAEIGRRKQQKAVDRLTETIYRAPDGARILWQDMTRDVICHKIAQLRKHVGSLVDHIHILEAAEKVLADHGAERLGDVPDWPALVRQLVLASGPVVDAGSGTAREPQSSVVDDEGSGGAQMGAVA